MPCMASPPRISGRYFRCCSAVPKHHQALAWIAAPIRGASPRSIVSMKASCSCGERELTTNPVGHPSPIQPVWPISPRKLRIEFALGERLAVEGHLRSPDQFTLQPMPHLFAQIVAGRTKVILRKSRSAMIEQERGHAAPRVRRAAQRDGVEMHALEMTWRLVLLGITDGPKCVLGFKRNAPQRVAGVGGGRVGEISPARVAAIMQERRVIERGAVRPRARSGRWRAWCWIAWNLPMACPNCCRSLA